MEFTSLKYAYIGDAVFELKIREYLLLNLNIKMNNLHKTCTKIVCASNQAYIIEKLIDDNFLNEDEIQVYKTARNTKTYSKSKNSNILDYHKATGFEALIGFLYLNNKNRLNIILDKSIDLLIENKNE